MQKAHSFVLFSDDNEKDAQFARWAAFSNDVKVLKPAASCLGYLSLVRSNEGWGLMRSFSHQRYEMVIGQDNLRHS